MTPIHPLTSRYPDKNVKYATNYTYMTIRKVLKIQIK